MILAGTLSLLISFSLNISAQSSSGFRFSLDYGVDSDISSAYYTLPDHLQYAAVNNQYVTKHPFHFMMGYFYQRNDYKYSFNAGFLNRCVNEYTRKQGRSGGFRNFEQITFGAGISRRVHHNSFCSIELGLDANFSLAQKKKLIGGGTLSLFNDFETFRRSWKISYGNVNTFVVPIFSFYFQTIFPSERGHSFVLGLGLNTSLFKMYEYEMQVTFIEPDRFSQETFTSSPLTMWFPFIRAGYLFGGNKK